jgi:hypothetical protein
MSTDASTFGECRDETRAFYRKHGVLSTDIITRAVDSLTEPRDMRAYFIVLQQISAADILKGRRTKPAAEGNAQCRSTARIAEERAYKNLRQVIAQCSSTEAYQRWSTALPELGKIR